MNNNRDRLLLIDGNALMHRAYHAMPPLKDRQGNPRGAVYGFLRMMLRTMRDLQPLNVAVCFDRPEPTFRKQLYIAYQAQRPEMEPDLVYQMQSVHDVLKAMGTAVFEMPGYEADDLLGTISHKVSGLNKSGGISKQVDSSEETMTSIAPSDLEDKSSLPMETIILTGDKDLMQLVSDSVYLYMPKKGVNEALWVDRDQVKAILGIPPELVVDYKGLVGDASDNYPGVVGIGPKTAIQLLEEFKNMDGIYEAVDNLDKFNLKPNVVKKLLAGRDGGVLSRELATIKTDVDFKFDLNTCINVLDNPGKLARVLDDFGFKSLANQLGLESQVGDGAEQMQLL